MKLSDKINNYWFINNHHHAINSLDKFNKLFFSFINSNINVNNYKIFDIQDNMNDMDKNMINILFCVENCKYWKHYNHYNIYKDFGNNKISIYLYNHINKFIETNDYIAIPIIYLHIDYFNTCYNIIKPSNIILFKNKKFCLYVNNIKKKTNLNKKRIINIEKNLKKIGICDHISLYSGEIKNISCYHTDELLNIFNNYKFIFCFENSNADGYITEKIFNVFFSRSIPLYIGPNDKFNYFDENSFIDIANIDTNMINKINLLSNNEIEYNNFINNIKISKNFNNENYKEKSNIFLNKLFQKK
jgi:hypothetical protein